LILIYAVTDLVSVLEPLPEDYQAVVSPQGTVPDPYSFSMSTMNATQLPGGSVKVVDSTIFKISTETAVAEVTVEPGAMRELHVSCCWLINVT
jgi:oxalate decarboxylase/phosphoglucose isomerase-like protein (cupin superfamily)